MLLVKECKAEFIHICGCRDYCEWVLQLEKDFGLNSNSNKEKWEFIATE